ncbi:MAG: hypothetical protein ABI598_05195 [Chloroflexota bacterium]
MTLHGTGHGPAYTPAMRRLMRLATLLLGFSSTRYTSLVRAARTVPLVQPVALLDPDGTYRGPAWWTP